MNIEKAIEELNYAVERKNRINKEIKNINGNHTRLSAIDIISLVGNQRLSEQPFRISLPKDLAIKLLMNELEVTQQTIDKIQPVVDASNAMLKGIFGGE